jgi:4-amino-4-deoxy-L-arabinose transferase-like glycosyltransferase
LTRVDVDALVQQTVQDDPVTAAPAWLRRPVFAVFALALALRAGLGAAVLLSHHWPVAPDERQYVELASVIASGRPASAWDPAWGHDLLVQTATFLEPVILLFRLFGAHVYLAMLVSALAGAAAAAATTRLGLEQLPRVWAVAAGAVVALLPSQVLWSGLVLRESAVWATLAALGLVAAVALRTRAPRPLILLALAAAADLLALAHLRPYVFVVACWTLVLATVVGRAARRIATPAVALGLMLVVPAVTGNDVAGYGLVSHNAPALGQIQQHLANGADSAIVKPSPTASTSTTSRPRPVDDSGGGAAGPRHIFRGLVAVSLRPFVWERPTSGESAFAQVENVIWIGLYLLAGFGAWVSRRQRQVIAFPVIWCGGYLVMSALFEGNVGTAFRHRGQIAWAVALLAAIGAAALAERRRPVPSAPL